MVVHRDQVHPTYRRIRSSLLSPLLLNWSPQPAHEYLALKQYQLEESPLYQSQHKVSSASLYR